ncbi:MAG: cobalt-precorrin-5B (C(1))-methyltransferase [Alphaproteobacteria bacterium]
MDRDTDSEDISEPRPGAGTALRRGWTTGACATAAAKAAATAIFSGRFPDPVSIRLPRGQEPAFALCRMEIGQGWARASIIKDAGDDPDVTHGAEVAALVRLRSKAGGRPPAGAVADVGEIRIFAGPGVGTVTLAGLPVVPGEPAVNPVPRQMISAALCDVASQYCVAPAFDVELSVVDGEALAEKTWNPRLGIVGGLSILGTTGIVVPYSCAAWIDAIHRGVDVARAAGFDHLVGATGRGSEQAAMAHYRLDRLSMIDMGDFAGGLLKYARAHPVARLTLAGGFAKISKLAQGALDLHSARSQVAFDALADISRELGASDAVATSILGANTGAEALAIGHDAGIDLALPVANRAADQARVIVGPAGIKLNVIIVARDGAILAETDFA